MELDKNSLIQGYMTGQRLKTMRLGEGAKKIPVVIPLNATHNGGFVVPSGVDGFSPVTVNVAGGGYPEPTGSIEITENRTYNVKDVAEAVVNVPDVPAVTEELEVTQNGVYTPDPGVDGFSQVDVLVQQTLETPLTVTQNGTYTAQFGYAYNPVTVNVPQPSGEFVITQNGTYNISQYASVIVNVSGGVESNYITFSSANPFTIGVYDNTKHWDGQIEYSTDKTTWSVWDGTSAISSVNGKLYMRGTGNSIIAGDSSDYRWIITGNSVSCTGRLTTLLDYQTESATMDAECFAYMFYGCTSLVTPPQLPATTLADYCYSHMFYGCTALTTAPALPATTLADSCYDSMFEGCTSLVTPPALPATTLAFGCYFCMFRDCTALTVAPQLPATILSDYCCYNMFYGCTSLEIYRNSGSYQYRIPASGTGADGESALTDMFTDTGGDNIGTPTINTTYYTDNEPV